MCGGSSVIQGVGLRVAAPNLPTKNYLRVIDRVPCIKKIVHPYKRISSCLEVALLLRCGLTMSIYLYAKTFPPHQNPVHNGVIKAVHGLATGLAAEGGTIYLLSEDRQQATIQTEFGYTHYCFANTNPNPTLKLAPDLTTFVKTHITPEDLVILNGGFHLSVYALAKLLRSRGIPYVMAPHLTYDRSMFAKSYWRKSLYWQLCERPLLQQAKAVQVLNQSQAVWLRQRGITTPVIEVQNGFAAADRLPLVPPWRSSPTAPVRLLFFGRLSRYIKGLDLLIEAFSQLCNQPQLPALELSLQGADAGDAAQLFQTAWDFGVSDRVHFLHPNYVVAPPELIAAHDILCLTSRSEGFGLAALEGMLAGRILLVSETAGIADHVRASGCGIVVKPTVQSIQAGLQSLLQRRDEWAAMGGRGRQYALEHLPWRKIAQQALPQYLALMAAPPARPLALRYG
jgi:glycosyltransferase involved in cell wall biosynthesis